MSDEAFQKRAAGRRSTWGMEAFDTHGNLVATNGKSTSLLKYAETNEERLANMEAHFRLCAFFYPELSNGTRMNRDFVVKSFRELKK